MQNETKIPKAYLVPWRITREFDKPRGLDLGEIGPHNDEVIGEACHIMALDILTTAERHHDTGYMTLGCFLLELAVLYEKHDAAANLINYHNDPVKAALLAEAALQTDIREAQALIRNLATKSPLDTPPDVMLVYLREEYSPRKIGTQNPRQLQWGFMISKNLNPELDILRGTLAFDVYPHPAQIRLQIIEHCLSKNISLPDVPLDSMPQARHEALQQLINVNDPRASMIWAVREDGPELYSKQWADLVRTAAAGGIPQACHLTSIHHMREEGILPPTPDSKARLDTSIGLEYGRICILSYLESPDSFVGITVSYAALCRAVGDYDRGLSLLEESHAIAQGDPVFSRRSLARLEDHIKDYKLTDPRRAGYWDGLKLKRLLSVFDAERLIENAREDYN